MKRDHGLDAARAVLIGAVIGLLIWAAVFVGIAR
jgi:hypothetical protein